MGREVGPAPISILSLLILLSILSACVGHATRFQVQEEKSLLSEEIARLSAAIGDKVEPMGMVQHPRLETIRNESETSAEYPFVVVDEWVRERGTPGDDVRVFVGKSKVEGSVFVVVQNRNWPRRTSFTDRLEEAVGAALRESLPDRQLTITRGAHGLFAD